MGAGRSGGGNTSTTESGTGPPSWQVPYLTTGFENALSLFQGGGPSLYGGSFTAGFTPEEREAQAAALAYGRGGAQDLANAGQGAAMFGLGDVLSPDTNPYLAQTAEANARQITRALQEDLLPSIQGEAVASGNVGSSRQGVAEGIATRGASEAIADSTTKLYNDAYTRGLDTFDRTLGGLPGTIGAGMMPSSIVGGVGAQQRAMNQAGIDEQLYRHEFQQMLPYLMLAQYMSTVGGNFGGQGTTTTTTPQSLFDQFFGTQGLF